MAKTESMVVTHPGHMEMQEFETPRIGPSDMLLRVERVSICGSDPNHFLGLQGDEAFPFILGHELVGFVEEIGTEAVRDYQVSKGDRVVVEPYIPCRNCRFCQRGNYALCERRRVYGFSVSCSTPPHLWGAYGEFMYVAPGSMVHRISCSPPAEAACLSSVIGNGIRWVRTKGKARLGDKVVILGPGAQGLASVIAAKESGARPIMVTGMSKDAHKLKLAQEFGADFTLEVEREDVAARVKEITEGKGADLVIECTGTPESLRSAFGLLRPEGRLVIAGTFKQREVPIKPDWIVFRELEVVGGLGQALDVEDAVGIIEAGKYAIEKIITHQFPVDQAAEAMKFFMEAPADSIRVALIP
jgi:threonine dehydrogenase-like Zn-dependent dehydrogenase